MWHVGALTIRTPSDFDFWRTAYSHGWCDLVPFTFDLSRRTLGRILLPETGYPVECIMREARGGVTVALRSREPLTRAIRRSVIRQLNTCLRLDEDFTPFHSVARKHPRFRWTATSRSGRMLRAPTLFEDIVKMICTTNCTWALTRIMVTNIVGIAGRRFDTGINAFPDARRLAQLTEREVRKDVTAGYRAPYLLELAERVASGKLNVESWRTSTLPTETLLTELRTIKGVGPYAAENLLRLLGRYDRLGLDSWTRARYFELHGRGREISDRSIERDYKEYGAWRGLFFWLEMTREWHDDKFTPGDGKTSPVVRKPEGS